MGDYENKSQRLLSVQVSWLLRLLATLHMYVDLIQQSNYGTIIIIFVTTIWQYLDDMIITGNFNHDYHDNQNIAHPYYFECVI